MNKRNGKTGKDYEWLSRICRVSLAPKHNARSCITVDNSDEYKLVSVGHDESVFNTQFWLGWEV